MTPRWTRHATALFGGKPRPALIVCAAAVILLAIADAGLIRQNRNLRHQLSGGKPLLAPPIGRHVPALSGVNLQGVPQTIDYSSSTDPTFVFVFSDTCGICDETWPRWKSMLRPGRALHARPVFVSTTRDIGPDLLRQHGLESFPVFDELDPKDVVAYNLQLTPEVYEVSPKGIVVAAWVGGLDNSTASSLAQALGAGG
ncbi:MAG: TlpA family protein disulfide reductase, partial [Acetobacteraceae bacterium]